jgi:hypothetical protein
MDYKDELNEELLDAQWEVAKATQNIRELNKALTEEELNKDNAITRTQEIERRIELFNTHAQDFATRFERVKEVLNSDRLSSSDRRRAEMAAFKQLLYADSRGHYSLVQDLYNASKASPFFPRYDQVVYDLIQLMGTDCSTKYIEFWSSVELFDETLTATQLYQMIMALEA